MIELDKVIQTLEYFKSDCDPMEAKLARHVDVAIQLLRAGAQMRAGAKVQASRSLSDMLHEISKAGEAWDAALGGEDE